MIKVSSQIGGDGAHEDQNGRNPKFQETEICSD